MGANLGSLHGDLLNREAFDTIPVCDRASCLGGADGHGLTATGLSLCPRSPANSRPSPCGSENEQRAVRADRDRDDSQADNNKIRDLLDVMVQSRRPPGGHVAAEHRVSHDAHPLRAVRRSPAVPCKGQLERTEQNFCSLNVVMRMPCKAYTRFQVGVLRWRLRSVLPEPSGRFGLPNSGTKIEMHQMDSDLYPAWMLTLRLYSLSVSLSLSLSLSLSFCLSLSLSLTLSL